MTRTRRTVTGLGLVIGGALLGLLSLTALPWFRGSFGGVLNFGTKPADLRQTFAFYSSARDIYDVIDFGISEVYFAWLGVSVLLFAALSAAATVGFDARASRAASLVAAVTALAGVVVTAFAIRVVAIDGKRLESATGKRNNPPGWVDYFLHSSFGVWGAVLAFVAIGVGAVLAAGGRDSLRTLLADPDEDEPTAEPTAEPTTEPTAEPTTDATAETDEPAPAQQSPPRRPDW